MRKIMILALFVVGAAGWGQAQDMPPEMKKFWDNYIKDSTATWGPLYAKRYGAISDSVQIKDLRMRILQNYSLTNISLTDYPDTVALSEIIKPSVVCFVLIMAHNKPLYQLKLNHTKNGPKMVSATFPKPGSDFSTYIWEPILKTYPESTGINPVLVTNWNGSSVDYFLYFKQKGPRKIFFFPGWNDTLNSMFTASRETLDDSKKLIEYWKKKELNKDKNTDERMGLEKAKSIGSNEKVEPKAGSHPPIYSPGTLKKSFNGLSIDEISGDL